MMNFDAVAHFFYASPRLLGESLARFFCPQQTRYQDLAHLCWLGNIAQVQQYLERLSEDDLPRAIKYDDFYCFRAAAIAGHQHVIELLCHHISVDLQHQMLISHRYDAFRFTVSLGRLDLLSFLYEKLPQRLRFSMIEFEDYALFIMAANHGFARINQFLWDRASQEQQALIIAAQDYKAFRLAAAFGHYNVVRFLWNKATELGCQNAMLCSQNYDAYRSARIQQRDAIVFFLRENASVQQYEIMEHLALIAVEQLPPEERPLQRYNPVRYHNTYLHRDIYQPIDNAESSMIDLTSAQEAQFQQLQDYYSSKRDVCAAMAEFRQILIDLYQKKPAVFVLREGLSLSLPLCYQELQRFIKDNHLSKRGTQIMRCYYSHNVHTAYRYCLEDNPWLHPQAHHGVLSERGIKRTLFKEYQKLITITFQAAVDPELGADYGDPQDRLDFFLSIFSDIVRAHNRESTGYQCIEQADDQQADKPSCGAGIKSRLFTAVISHPAFIPVTDIIESQIVAGMREHFKKKITADNAKQVLQAWERCIEMPSAEHIEVLKMLDPTSAELDEMILCVTKNLKEQFYEFQVVKKYIQSTEASTFIRSKLSISPAVQCYALSFAQRVSLDRLIASSIQQSPAPQLDLLADSASAPVLLSSDGFDKTITARGFYSDNQLSSARSDRPSDSSNNPRRAFSISS